MRTEHFLGAWLGPRICFDGAGEGTGGAGGDDTAAGGGGVDTLVAGSGDDTLAGGGDDTVASGDGGVSKWWEDKRFSDDERRTITASGLTVDDPLDAVKRLASMEINAQRKLGAKPDQLLQKPKEGQAIPDWMRANGEIFGIPEAADKYEVARPEGWPEGQDWDADLETQARQIAHEEGLSGKALNRMVGLYADKMKGLLEGADEQLAQANTEMMAQLTKDWGAETQARVTQAQQAASVLAAKAGLSAEQIEGISMSLKPKVGDAGVIRLFAAVGEMLGDDGMEALNAGGGGFNTTPAEARAELAQLRAEGGAYYEAVNKNDHRALKDLKPKIDRLTKIAAT